MAESEESSAPKGVGLHVCCAPCLARARESIRRENSARFPTISKLFFFNPNIHPLLEFRRRIKALRIYLERDLLPAGIDDSYGLAVYLKHMLVGGELPSKRRDRCYQCYYLRLHQAARQAANEGMTSFSTTLLASREQDHGLIETAGREACDKAGIEFIAADFSGYDPDPKLMRGIYKQQYCGCIFSEAERYQATGKHLYRPEGSGLDDDEDN